jgi:hypothetical protein
MFTGIEVAGMLGRELIWSGEKLSECLGELARYEVEERPTVSW